MKTKFKLFNLLVLALVITAFSCSNDDDIVAVPAPVITLQDLEVTIDENPTNGQVIGTVQSDSNGSLSYNIDSQTPLGALSIDVSSGELSVADATVFDFETNQIITATVSASGAANTVTVIINLTDVADVLVTYTETIRPEATEGKDAFIYTFNADANFGNHQDFMVFNGNSTTRCYMQFDFSEIPESATVNSVELSLYSYTSQSNGNHFTNSNGGLLQKVEADWAEDTITWNTQPASTEVNQAVLAPATSAIQDYLDIDVTDLMSGMIQDQITNHGIVFKLEDETASGKMVFASSDNADPDLHPKVVVSYSVYE